MTMARGKCTFRQRDVKAAMKAAFDAGAKSARVEVGGIVIVAQVDELTGQGEATASELKQHDEWGNL